MENKNARVWGSFFNVTNLDGKENDAQIIGSEIDVTNNSADGVYPNASKVGLQIVSLGSKLSTNAIEILAAGENTGWVRSASIYGDDINNGYLVLQNGKSGLRIVNNANNENILIINDDGSISEDCLIYKKYLKNNYHSNSNFALYFILLALIIINYIIFNRYKNKTEQRLLLLETKINNKGVNKNENKKNNKK